MTKVEWLYESCVACLKPFEEMGKLRRSDAHVIPESLGGRLSLSCLCQGCNSLIGTRYEDKLPLVETYANEMERFAEIVPAFARQLRKPGRIYVARSEHGPLKVKRDRRDGAFRVVDTELESGRFKDSRLAAREIRQRLTRQNVDPAEIEDLLGRFEKGEAVQVGAETFVPHSGELQPIFASGVLLGPDEAYLGIAYLWLACNAGPAIYAEKLHGVREALLGEIATRDGSWRVERFQTTRGGKPRQSEPWHRLVMSQKTPIAIDVTLFGRWFYRITFATVGWPGPRGGYRLNLETGKEEAVALRDDGAASSGA